MSWITACPECETSFHVQPEQLATSKGMVRCGNCNNLFNALDRLAVKEAITEVADHPVVEKPEDESVFAYTVISKEIIHNPAMVADAASKDKLTRPVKPVPDQWFALILMALLVLLAVVQITYHQRTQIASRWPITKPYLVQACDLLDCKVGLPQQINLLAVDDSDLQEDAELEGLMHFSSAIINNANFAQAYPLLELTLTDVADKPLLRRIFSPSEYLPPETNPLAGIEANAEVRIQLDIAVSDMPVAGYRVFISYVE